MTAYDVLADKHGCGGSNLYLKVLQILEMKGAVTHASEGRAYRYSPLVQPDEAGTTALKRIVDKIFHGSAELLLARLISDRDIPPDELERMRSLLDDDGEEGADR